MAATASYDPLDRLTRLTYAKGTNTIADWQYQFDDAHQITQIAEPTGNRTYTYDVLNRLTAAARPNQAVSQKLRALLCCRVNATLEAQPNSPVGTPNSTT